MSSQARVEAAARVLRSKMIHAIPPNWFGDDHWRDSATAALAAADEAEPTRAMPSMHNPEHEEPFALFVAAMADELRANAHKGDRPGWLADGPRVLIGEVLYHAAKLSYALRQYQQGEGEPGRVLEFAADTANMALMVADSAGVLCCNQRGDGE